MAGFLRATGSSLVKYGIFIVVLVISYLHFLYLAMATRLIRRGRPTTDADEDGAEQEKTSTKKLIVVTGADRGFGRELAEDLFEGGDEKIYVLALTLTTQAASALNRICKSKEPFDPPRLVGRKCDVSSDIDVSSMKQYVDKLLQDNGDMQLHAIVNNAGTVDPGDFLWYEDIESYQHIMNVNFFGQLRVTRALLPFMLTKLSRNSNKGGNKPRIINMSSVCGTSASPGNSAYSASKFAVEAWSDSLRLELKPFGVSVVKVRPGQIQTQIQEEWVANFLKRYDGAPEFAKKLYGGDLYRQKATGIFESTSGNEMTKSDVVVHKLKEILDIPMPKSSYWVGDDAKTFWRALATMHADVADSVKAAISIAPAIEYK